MVLAIIGGEHQPTLRSRIVLLLRHGVAQALVVTAP